VSAQPASQAKARVTSAKRIGFINDVLRIDLPCRTRYCERLRLLACKGSVN
jgi:hypothetical protein